MSTVRVALADDERMVRTALRVILDAEPDLEVVGEAATGAEAVSVVRQLRPDVVLMDVRMPEIDGIRATEQILSTMDEPPRIVVVTTFENDSYVYDALRAGAAGFLLKRLPTSWSRRSGWSRAATRCCSPRPCARSPPSTAAGRRRPLRRGRRG
jgi:DNA-binding NarL/FixJ family response regulator